MRSHLWLAVSIIVIGLGRLAAAEDASIDYDRDVAPLLRKYCGGCHNESDREGDFSLETYAALLKGTEEGPALLPGDPDGSRIVRLITGAAEPRMPPDGEARPDENEVALLKRWIEQGAKGPEGAEPDRLTIRVPAIPSRTDTSPITSLDFSPDGAFLAIGRFGQVTILQASEEEWREVRKIEGLPGKVNSVHFCFDGTRLVTASGVDGSGGLATLWDARTGERIRDFRGHRDTLFDAEVSPDGTLLATCSYDRQIILWNVETGERLRTMQGHNGAVYDLAFSPDGNVLASASADDTCKLWRVRDGERLDTLGQPLKEQYGVAFSPDGKFIAAGGADNRIRVWRFVSKERPRINPLVHARFAHEGPIVQLAYTQDGSRLVSVAEDRTIKVWETKNYTELELIENDPEVAMALAVHPRGQDYALGRLDGSLGHFRIKPSASRNPMTPPHRRSRSPSPPRSPGRFTTMPPARIRTASVSPRGPAKSGSSKSTPPARSRRSIPSSTS